MIGWVFLELAAPGQDPEWAIEARTRPVLENTGNSLIAMLPDNPEGLLQQLRNRGAPDGEPAEPAEPDPQRPGRPPQQPQRRS